VEIIDNKALLLTLRHPQRVTTVIPKSKELPNNKVLVKWGLDEAKVLRNLKIRGIPSPILGAYDWPGQYKPFDHQKDTAAFLTLNQRAFCFNEQGTGKTGSVIWAADYLIKQRRIKRVLVICPLSIMDSAWRADLFKLAMHRSVDIAYGAKDKRRAIIKGNAEFIIINFDGVELVSDEIANGGFDLIVVDEANAYKNVQTKRWKILNSLLKPDTWLWMLTGTPAAQSPLDAYGLAKLVNPQAIPRFFSAFRDQVMVKLTNFRWVAAGEEVTSVNAAVNMSKLLQISCGAVYSDTGETLEFDISNRYKVLKEVIEEASQKVLIFVPFKHVISILTAKLIADGITTEVINGDVPVARRTDIFKRFQETEDPRVMVIQPQAAAHGVTLTAANTVVWWGPTPSLETYAQANARVHRSGQRHPSTVVQLAGSPAERHVYKLLDNKIDVHSKIVDLYKEILE
jgi:SNF2 family DNA or RNA helicase